MKKSLLRLLSVIFTCIFLFACSGEEQSEKPFLVVKKPISKPVRERFQPESGQDAVKNSNQGTANQMQMAGEKSGSSANPAGVEKKQPNPNAEVGPKANAGQPQQKAIPRAPSGLSVAVPGSEKANGLYLVNKGDTLAGVSERREVYGDRLKWPILYRLNAEPLDSLPAADNLPDLPLPDGMKLKTVTPEEKTTNLEKRSGGVWVVNVLSAKTNAEAIPVVISLIKNGYPVYLVHARVNEKDWIRVRVGFFKTKEEAEAEGKKIREILSFQDSWVTKLARKEFMEFAGF
jgi:hypothetical protein